MKQRKAEQYLAELKPLFVAYLADKVVRNADAAFGDRACTVQIFEALKKEHFHKSA